MAIPVINDERELSFELGKGIVLKKEPDVTIIATGLVSGEYGGSKRC